MHAQEQLNAEALEKFRIWFEEPYAALDKRCENEGNGAFVALSIGLFLCERYFRSITKTIDNHNDPAFKLEAARYLNVDAAFFRAFWNIYRNGMQHQGSPKQTADYSWCVNAEFPPIPARAVVNGKEVICINPWAFTAKMIALWKNDPERLAQLSSHQLGAIFSKEIKPVLVPFTGNT